MALENFKNEKLRYNPEQKVFKAMLRVWPQEPTNLLQVQDFSVRLPTGEIVSCIWEQLDIELGGAPSWLK